MDTQSNTRGMEFTPLHSTLFRFEFDEGYFINSICIRAESFSKALDQVTLILHESVLEYVSFIHKIS